MNRNIAAAGAMLVASLLLTGCGTSAVPKETAGPPIKGGVIEIAWASQPPTLDPGAVTTTSTNFIGYNVFEGLVGLDADLNVRPVLAESWSHENYQTYTFNIRPDVRFHNGEPMTANDVVASLERWIADSTTGKASFVGAKVDAPDKETVVLTTAEPNYTAVYELAQPTQQAVVMPTASIQEKVDGRIPLEFLLGTGPFKIGEVVPEEKIVLDRFMEYSSPSGVSSGLTGEKVAMADSLVFNIVLDQTTRINGLSSGQYDFATEISTDNIVQLDRDPNLQKTTLQSGILTLLINKMTGPLADVTARKAIQAGLDIEAIFTAAYGSEDYFDLNGALAPRGQSGWYSEAGLDAYNQADIAAASKLLEESNYEGEPVRLVTTRDYPYMYNSAVVIADQLTEVGFKVELVVTDWAGVLDSLAKPSTWELSSVDFLLRPSPLALSFFNPSYFGGTSDPAIADAIVATNAATNEAEALAGVDALQEAFFEYVPVIKFGEIRAVTGQTNRVGGLIQFLGPVFYGAYRTEAAE